MFSLWRNIENYPCFPFLPGTLACNLYVSGSSPMPPRPPSQQTDGQNSSHMSQSAMPAPGRTEFGNYRT